MNKDLFFIITLQILQNIFACQKVQNKIQNKMGNQQCCQSGNKGQEKHQKIQLDDYQPQILPDLSQSIKKLLHQKRPFQNELKSESQIVTRQYGQDFYQGPVDIDNRPHGFGKFYKKDGSLLITEFKQGKSEGPSIFIFPGGAYYQGNLKNNKAEDQNGYYQNQHFIYEGGFHQNSFHGKGKEKGQGYYFEGQYYKGRKVKGILKWEQGSQQYQYEGQFNQDFLFENEGVLKQGSIGVYKGQFKNGKKHGKGIYAYTKNDIRYEGQYRDGLKSGQGTIYNHDNTIAYSGNFQRDLPNGEGFVIQDGKKLFAIFKDGLDTERLQ